MHLAVSPPFVPQINQYAPGYDGGGCQYAEDDANDGVGCVRVALLEGEVDEVCGGRHGRLGVRTGKANARGRVYVGSAQGRLIFRRERLDLSLMFLGWILDKL